MRLSLCIEFHNCFDSAGRDVVADVAVFDMTGGDGLPMGADFVAI